MNVLHLPNNIASQINVSVKALNDLGVNARGLVLSYSAMQDHRYIESVCIDRKKFSLRTIIGLLSFWKRVWDAVNWADVVHWHFDSYMLPFNLDLRYIAWRKKARVVEFWGSDIRIPEVAVKDNPYIAKMYEQTGGMSQQFSKRSLRNQQRFSRYGFFCLLPDREVEPYLQKKYFPTHYKTSPRVLISEYKPCFPNPHKTSPLIVHAPSCKEIKGSQTIIDVLKRLKMRYDFQFDLLHNIPKEKANEIVQKCDIFIDEIIHGSYGLAAIEAMALGKPTICYIKPSMLSAYPAGLPIINANEGSLEAVLEKLLLDGNYRNEVGRASRIYVEKYHDAHKIAQELTTIYEDVLKKTSQAQ
jgi:hypothetical protein